MFKFESFIPGEDLLDKDTNIGHVTVDLSNTNFRPNEPISFFATDVILRFSWEILEPLIRHFSGCEKGLKSIDLSQHVIWLTQREDYRKRLLGKVIGCEVKKEFPYSSYSFGFTPFFFFFDPNFEGKDISDPQDPGTLGILRTGNQFVLDAYRSLMSQCTIENELGLEICNFLNEPQLEMSDFLWEIVPHYSDWKCWVCYFSSKKKEVGGNRYKNN